MRDFSFYANDSLEASKDLFLIETNVKLGKKIIQESLES